MREIFDYDVFLSFAISDEQIAKSLWQELCQNGLRVFWSDAALKKELGESWSDVIQSALERSTHFLLLVSDSSMSSKWVKREYDAFFNNFYKPGVRKLIPLLTPGYQISEMPLFLRQLQALRLDVNNTIKEVVHLLGGANIDELRGELAKRDAENRVLIQKVHNLESELVNIKYDVKTTSPPERKTNPVVPESHLQGDAVSRDSARVETNPSTALSEAAIAEAVSKALGDIQFSPTGYYPHNDLNSPVVGKKLYALCQGTEIPFLCGIVADVKHANRFKALLLLKFSACQRVSPDLAQKALEVICGSFLLSDVACDEAVRQIRLPREIKWKYLMAVLDNPQSSPRLMSCLITFTSPEMRERTGAAIVKTLEITLAPYNVSGCIDALKTLNYRSGIAELRELMAVGASIDQAGGIASLLGEWGDVKSTEIIKELLERWRYNSERFKLLSLIRAYYAICAKDSFPLLRGLLEDSTPAVKQDILAVIENDKLDMTYFADSIKDLAENSPVADIKKTAQKLDAIHSRLAVGN